MSAQICSYLNLIGMREFLRMTSSPPSVEPKVTIPFSSLRVGSGDETMRERAWKILSCEQHQGGRENLTCMGEQDHNGIYTYALRTVVVSPTSVSLGG